MKTPGMNSAWRKGTVQSRFDIDFDNMEGAAAGRGGTGRCWKVEFDKIRTSIGRGTVGPAGQGDRVVGKRLGLLKSDLD